MSNVLKLNRNLSEMEFYKLGEDIQGEALRLMMNEKVVPKRWRQIFSVPMAHYTVALMQHISDANAIYPNMLCEAETRREHQDDAIRAVHDMYQLLQTILRTLRPDVAKFETLTQMLVREEELLLGWRKSDYGRFFSKINQENQQVMR